MSRSPASAPTERARFKAPPWRSWRALLHEIDHLDGILILDRIASPSEVFPRKRRFFETAS